MNALEQTKIAKRYAKALYEAADQANSVPAILSLFLQLREQLKHVPPLTTFLNNPVIPANDKLALLNDVLGGIMPPVLTQFFKLLAEHERLPILKAAIDCFETIYNHHAGIGKAVVMVPVTLSESLTQRLKQTLCHAFQLKDVQLTIQVEPTLIAGAVVKMGDKLIDGSYLGKFNLLRKQVG